MPRGFDFSMACILFNSLHIELQWTLVCSLISIKVIRRVRSCFASLVVQKINSVVGEYFSPNLVRVLNPGGLYERLRVSKNWKVEEVRTRRGCRVQTWSCSDDYFIGAMRISLLDSSHCSRLELSMEIGKLVREGGAEEPTYKKRNKNLLQ